MKKNILLFILFFFATIILAQPGKYAGAVKKIIGTIYADSRNISLLKGWQFREGSVLNPLTDPEMITVDVFQKGTTCVVFFSIKEDTASNEYKIFDAIEIKGVTKGWTIKTALCRQNKIEHAFIFAWVKETSTEYLRTVKKAWLFNPDKRMIQMISIKNIDCINEGFGE
jgi:hypothetical protein